MSTILEHSLDEIKRYPQRTYCPVTRRQSLNRALAEILATDPSDDMYDYLVGRYLQSLDLYHVNGRAGSLLPKEEEASAPAPTAAQVIAAANTAYDNVYAPRIPYMLAGTVEDAATGYKALQAALAGGAA